MRILILNFSENLTAEEFEEIRTSIDDSLLLNPDEFGLEFSEEDNCYDYPRCECGNIKDQFEFCCDTCLEIEVDSDYTLQYKMDF